MIFKTPKDFEDLTEMVAKAISMGPTTDILTVGSLPAIPDRVLKLNDLLSFNTYEYLPPFDEDITLAHVWAVFAGMYFYDMPKMATKRELDVYLSKYPVSTSLLCDIVMTTFEYALSKNGVIGAMFWSGVSKYPATVQKELNAEILVEYNSFRYALGKHTGVLIEFAMKCRKEFKGILNSMQYKDHFNEAFMQTFCPGYSPVSFPHYISNPFGYMQIDNEVSRFKHLSFAHFCFYEAAHELMETYGKRNSASIDGPTLEKARFWLVLGMFPGLGLEPILKMPTCIAHSYVFVNGEIQVCEKCGHEMTELEFSDDYWYGEI